ncbi:MAG: MBOAT family protein [Pseudomonadota bacterium]
MLFTSSYYIFAFLPIVFAGYFLLLRANWIVASRLWLVLASLYFYGYWNPSYLLLIGTSISVNFMLGRILQSSREQRDRYPWRHKVWLFAAIAFNLLLLGYFKYADFFIGNVNLALGTDLPLLHLILPLAISFFTFQQLAYLIDCYRNQVERYDFLRYSLFVSFFPQLIAGPIVHHREMMPQFVSPINYRLDWHHTASGVLLFGIGLFKKVVIADGFGVWANQGFADTSSLTLLDAWASSLSYTLQLYFDFSGYTDMAIGAALMFNIRLPENFDSPYKSLNIREFWRRWHMTLSRWLSSYVYVPLGGDRAGSFKMYRNLILTFLIGGFWHGAGWTFVVWGALHGIALCINRWWQGVGIVMPKLLAGFITFLFVSTALVVFRAEDMGSAFEMLGAMIGNHGMSTWQAGWQHSAQGFQSWRDVAGPINIVWIIIFAAVTFLAPNSTQIARGAKRFTSAHVALVAMALFASILLTISSEPPEFLYFDF